MPGGKEPNTRAKRSILAGARPDTNFYDASGTAAAGGFAQESAISGIWKAQKTDDESATSSGDAAAAAAASQSAGVEWRCSVEGKPWVRIPLAHDQERRAVAAGVGVGVGGQAAALLVSVTTAAVRHEIEGFGGCFNEKGWDALSVLDAAARTAVMQAMFGEQGLRWGLNRMPIGSSDFSDSYCLGC